MVAPWEDTKHLAHDGLGREGGREGGRKGGRER